MILVYINVCVSVCVDLLIYFDDMSTSYESFYA